MRADDASQAIAVGDRDRPMAECRRGQHQFVRMRSTAQKREIGGDLQLRVINGCHCEAPLGAEAISMGLLRCARNDSGSSGKDAMDKPARFVVTAVETRPEQPEASPLLILYPVVIADRLSGARPLGPPPFLGNPLGSVGLHHSMPAPP